MQLLTSDPYSCGAAISHANNYMITVADPQILWNDGFYPLVDVKIPEGSFWKPTFPAALSGRGRASRGPGDGPANAS